MAKGLRSSRNKTNNVKLRSNVFGPVESARKERLSAKLLELATKPKPKEDEDTEMDLDEKLSEGTRKMDVEMDAGLRLVEANEDIEQATKSNPAMRSTPRGTKRIEKKGRGKAKASMVFPVYKKGKRVGPRLSARQKKQSLKP